MKVLISGSFPESLNRNKGIKASLHDAMVDLIGKEKAMLTQYESCRKKILEFKPSLTLLVGSCMPDLISYSHIREACDEVGSKLSFWTVDDPYEFDARLKFSKLVDFIFCNDKYATRFYFDNVAYHLPLAADKKAANKPIKNLAEREIDFFFCGVQFPKRKMQIKELAPYLEKYNTLICGAEWSLKNNFIKNFRLSNKKVNYLYGNSKFTLNIGRDLNIANNQFNLIASTPGPRTFEAALSGGVQLYFADDYEIEEYYEPNKEILLYENLAEFIELAERCLKKPKEYIEMAIKARERTLNDHTYHNRAQKIIDILCDYL